MEGRTSRPMLSKEATRPSRPLSAGVGRSASSSGMSSPRRRSARIRCVSTTTVRALDLAETRACREGSASSGSPISAAPRCMLSIATWWPMTSCRSRAMRRRSSVTRRVASISRVAMALSARSSRVSQCSRWMRSAAPVAPPAMAEKRAAAPTIAPPRNPPSVMNAPRKNAATMPVPTSGCFPLTVTENSTSTAIIHTDRGSWPTAVTAKEAALVTTSPAHGLRQERATPAPARSTERAVGQSDPRRIAATIWPVNTSAATE